MRNQTLFFIAILTPIATFVPHASFEPQAATAQALQRGISVELAATRSARPIPDADKEGALIVAITSSGDTYLGINSVNLAALTEQVRNRLAGQKEKRLYIKADARTSYASVVQVLDALHAAGVEAAVLLTDQPVPPRPGMRVPPMGIELLMSSPHAKGR